MEKKQTTKERLASIEERLDDLDAVTYSNGQDYDNLWREVTDSTVEYKILKRIAQDAIGKTRLMEEKQSRLAVEVEKNTNVTKFIRGHYEGRIKRLEETIEEMAEIMAYLAKRACNTNIKEQ